MYENSVKRGAALLDERLAGWHDLIDVETLQLESPCDCVLGQLSKDARVEVHLVDGIRYVSMVRWLGLEYSTLAESDHGFNLPPYLHWSDVAYYCDLVRRYRLNKNQVYERVLLEAEAHWEELRRAWQAEVQARRDRDAQAAVTAAEAVVSDAVTEVVASGVGLAATGAR